MVETKGKLKEDVLKSLNSATEGTDLKNNDNQDTARIKRNPSELELVDSNNERD